MSGKDEESELKIEPEFQEPDDAEMPPKSLKLVSQPYDMVVHSLIEQIKKGKLHLRPLSEKPSFQRRYVWGDDRASKLIESILLNVPIPQCFLAQNDEYELEVIDGQQRIFSIYRFIDNQYSLEGLEVHKELNGTKFHKMEKKYRQRIENFTLRCVYITNESDENIKFVVFERLNQGNATLNAQELRNCIYRSEFMDCVNELAEDKEWLKCLGRELPDKRMVGEEMILRFFAFNERGLQSYKTPQKNWLNEMAKLGKRYDSEKVNKLRDDWKKSVRRAAILFDSGGVFRRVATSAKLSPINRSLMDLTMATVSRFNEGETKEGIEKRIQKFREGYIEICKNEEFVDLITRAVDHKSRTLRRFELWDTLVAGPIGLKVS